MSFTQAKTEENMRILEAVAAECDDAQYLKNRVWESLAKFKAAGYVEDVAFELALIAQGVKRRS